MLIYSHYVTFFNGFCKISTDLITFTTIIKTHNEKTIDHAELHTKQQK